MELLSTIHRKFVDGMVYWAIGWIVFTLGMAFLAARWAGPT
jgi:hypothetical protein